MEHTTDTKTILVIEDHAPLRQILVEKLNHEGLKTLEAEDGERAMEVAMKEHPDLILLDIIMPRMSGTTMLEALRKSGDWGKNVPVVFLTNLSPDDKIIKEVVQTGPIYYLVKADWKIEDVVKKVKDYLNQ